MYLLPATPRRLNSELTSSTRLLARAVVVRESHYPVGSRRPPSISACTYTRRTLLPLHVLVSVARSVKIQEVMAHRP